MKEQTSINSLEFAQEAREIHGTIAPRDLVRLADVLFSTDGQLDYQLQGVPGVGGGSELRLQLKGTLLLLCQRCMGPLAYSVDSTSRFVIVADEDKMPAPEQDQDGVDYLVADPAFDVAALVEDEILLGLPMVSLHEACDAAATTAKEQSISPFKVLQGLKFGKS